MTIPDPIAIHAFRNPDGDAVVEGSRRVSWSELDVLINGQQNRLVDSGLRAGGRAGIVAGGSIVDTVVALWAVLRSHATAVPISSRLPESAAASFIAESDCTLVVGDRKRVTRAEYPVVDRVSVGELSGHRTVRRVAFETGRHATICRTSGTTSLPKGAVHTVGNHFYSAWASNERVPLLPGDRWLLSIPLNHVGGLAIVFRCFVAGATIVGGASRDVGWDAAKFGATHVSLVATQLMRVLEGVGVDYLRGMRSILCGGSAIPQSLLERAVSEKLPVQVTYGMTEASSQIATTGLLSPDSNLRSAGFPLRHTAVSLDKDDEILIKGNTVFAGYLRGEAIEPSRDQEGWFRTGDLGRMGPDGLEVYGRKDNMFISGGENIKPEEIEFFLSSNTRVHRAVVVPIHDPEFGNRPVAFIQWATGGDFEDLARRLEGVLPRFKVPVHFFELPPEYRDISKIDRKKLQQIAAGRIAAAE